ncbi:MAG TPA: penicillin-binding protein 2 [Bryobacteraceae bacterium]
MSSLLDPDLQHKIDHPRITRDDPSFAVGKMAAFQYVSVAVFLFLIAGFWQLQVQSPEVYSDLAERNRVKQFPIPAPRGKILDRDGRTIVDNHSSWALMLTRENLKEEHLPAIAEGLHLDLEDLQAKVAKYRKRPSYEPIIIKEELTPADLAFVDSHRDPEFFPELILIHDQPRLYPQNGMGAHWIGYTGEVSEAELDSAEFAKFNPGQVIGKFGIERQYNDLLTGTDGERQVEVDNRGRERKVLQTTEAIPGKNLQLTIDLDLQVVADLVMEGKKGAIVALDPRNGEVLAMASRPAFDPNKFTVRIKSSEFRQLTTDPGQPFLNRAIQSQLAPGSTFKPIMAMTGLETGIIDPEMTFHCSGGASFYGQYHRCWDPRGHGTVNLLRGLVYSCDVYFYNVGNLVGIDNIAHYAELAGLGRKTGIDLPGEAAGVVPSPQRKIRLYRQKWYAGETISVAIGQGDLQVSPLQLAYAIGGLARDGVSYTPHMLKSLTPTLKPRIWGVNRDNIELVKEGMMQVVRIGTGGAAQLPGIEVCGKTGSAQTASDAYMKAHHQVTNAWFVAFAPRTDPQIVIAALYEGGGHGQFAAQLVRDVMKAYFDKQARLKQSAKGGPAAPDSFEMAYFEP